MPFDGKVEGNVMCNFHGKFNNFFLREATMEDMMLLFCWVNDPDVRRNSFSTDKVALFTHRCWFENALQDECVRIYILQYDELPVGQVRIESNGTEWKIDYSIDIAWRGKGYGRHMLFLLESQVSNGACLLGEVKSENISSQKVFEGLGYEKCLNTFKGIYEYRKQILHA